MPRIIGRIDDPTTSDHVTIADVTDDDTDEDLAAFAGLTDRHFGYNVVRYPLDHTARVVLWNT